MSVALIEPFDRWFLSLSKGSMSATLITFGKPLFSVLVKPVGGVVYKKAYV